LIQQRSNWIQISKPWLILTTAFSVVVVMACQCLYDRTLKQIPSPNDSLSSVNNEAEERRPLNVCQTTGTSTPWQCARFGKMTIYALYLQPSIPSPGENMRFIKKTFFTCTGCGQTLRYSAWDCRPCALVRPLKDCLSLCTLLTMVWPLPDHPIKEEFPGQT
jgi:hypothetical protein